VQLAYAVLSIIVLLTLMRAREVNRPGVDIARQNGWASRRPVVGPTSKGPCGGAEFSRRFGRRAHMKLERGANPGHAALATVLEAPTAVAAANPSHAALAPSGKRSVPMMKANPGHAALTCSLLWFAMPS